MRGAVASTEPIPTTQVPMTAHRSILSCLLATIACVAVFTDPTTAQGGRGRFVNINASGTLQTIKSHSWRANWHQIVPIRLGGTYHTDLLFYDRWNGEAKFYETDGTGGIKLISRQTGWRKTWDKVIPGHFAGSVSSPSDLLLYEASTGLARFYRVNTGGSLSLLKQHSWSHWDIIIPLNLGGSAYTDLLFYSRSRGQAIMYRTDGGGNLVRLRTLSFQKTWDVIVPGEFSTSGGTSDLFFYRKVIGDAKFYTTDATGKLTLLRAYTGLRRTWDVVTPGFFDSSFNTTDLLFYDRRYGFAQVALVQNGTIQWKPRRVTDKTWGLFVPGLFDAKAGTDVVFYDQTLRLRLHIVRCMDKDGKRAGDINPTMARQWIDRANTCWSAAGIQFDFDERTDYEEIRDSELNKLDTCKHFATQAECDAIKARATSYARREPCKITVFVRYGSNKNSAGVRVASGGGFSSPAANYVAMPGFRKTWTTTYFHDSSNTGHGASVPNIKLLAHELGHYLGIAHTFTGVSYKNFTDPHAAVLAYMSAKNFTTMAQMDGDDHVAKDTPPDLGITYYLLNNWNPANILQEIRIRSTAKGIDFTTNPDRHNVMSYFGICNDYLRVSPEQQRTARDWLQQTHRKYLLDRCNVPGLVTSFGSSCVASQKLSAAGNPGLGDLIAYDLTGAPAARPMNFAIGLSRRAWGPLPLPLNLGFLGAAGCYALNDQLVVIRMTTDSRGNARFLTRLPNDPTLYKRVFYTQGVVFDPSANSAGLTTTNALQTIVGG